MTDGTFKAPYDRMTKIVTGIVVLVLVAVPVTAIGSGRMAAILGVLSGMVIGLAFAFSPRGYEISGDALRVKRFIGDVVFPLGKLRFLRKAT
ncbi:MAG: hypothetical protein JO051_13545, partial [Acidobacteriaceae bacterium]|nr:hypothetical protein [Acidobacteriaceae bacterium]